MVGDGTVFKTGDDLHRRHGARLRPRPLPRRRLGPGRGDRAADAGDAAARHQRPALPRAPAEPHGRRRLGPRLLPLLAGSRARRGASCWVSRTGYSGELGYELFCSPDGAEQLWDAVVGAGAQPYGLAAVETIRIESGLIFIGYDYFQHETSPYDMGLDKVIRLDKGDFCGKAALAAEAQNPPNRFVTLVVDGGRSRVRCRGYEGRRAGRHADEPVREPDARQDDRPDRASLRPRARGRAGRGRGRRRHRSGNGRGDAHLRHGEDAAARIARGPVSVRRRISSGPRIGTTRTRRRM